MKLYGCKGCGSAAVEVILQLARVKYEFVDAIQWQPFQRHIELEALNPLGQVPVLVLDDGTVMTESTAILLYFSELMPGMIPDEDTPRALFYRWMLFVASNLYAVFQFRDFPERWVDGTDAQRAFREKTDARLQACWRILEVELRPAPYVIGAEMTTLDVVLAMCSRWGPGRAWITEQCPRLTAAIHLTEQHPVVNAVWENNFAS